MIKEQLLISDGSGGRYLLPDGVHCVSDDYILLSTGERFRRVRLRSDNEIAPELAADLVEHGWLRVCKES